MMPKPMPVVSVSLWAFVRPWLKRNWEICLLLLASWSMAALLFVAAERIKEIRLLVEDMGRRDREAAEKISASLEKLRTDIGDRKKLLEEIEALSDQVKPMTPAQCYGEMMNRTDCIMDWDNEKPCETQIKKLCWALTDVKP